MSTVQARPDFVQSLERGLAVITAFSADVPAQTLSEVARRTGLTRATARRLLLTLEKLGFVAKSGGRFRLLARVLDLGYAYLSALPVAELALPPMEDLSRTLHESSSAAVLDGLDVVYVARVPANRIMSIRLAVGARLPAYPTSMGRVLLADLTPEALDGYFTDVDLRPLTERTVVDETRLRELLAEVRMRGWAMVDQELEDGVRSIAAPLRDSTGRAVAALNVSTHAGRVNRERLIEEFLPALLGASRMISQALGSR